MDTSRAYESFLSELEVSRDDTESILSELEEKPQGDVVIMESWKPGVGIMFDTLADAELQIKAWARRTGFEAKRGRTKSGAENMGMHFFFQLLP